MDILTLDFETYYDQEYSLSHMTTEAYVRDSRFEPILVGIKFNDGDALWILPERFKQFAEEEVDWSSVTCLAHHAHFDGLILSHHYDVRPAFWLDTLSMARIVDGPKAGNSLEVLGPRHGLGGKGVGSWAKGKHAADFSAREFRAYGEYCINDCELTYKLAQKFLSQVTELQLKLIDLKIRMFTEPVFMGNILLLSQAVEEEKTRKAAMLARIGVDKEIFSSNDKFANLLINAGVEVPMKVSNTSGEGIPAFAKTDPGMQELLEHEDEEVRFLAETRLAVKSTIIETRAARFLACAERGPMPVYIKPNGTHTQRASAGDGMNWMNLTSVNKLRPQMTVLKRSIQAPPGCKVVAADSSQIQARLTNWLAGQEDTVQAFAEGRDVYSEFASMIYGRPVDRKKNPVEDFVPGQVGKVCLAEGTLVVTNRGLIPIEYVTMTDSLWDGVEWVSHAGLLFQGEKLIAADARLKATDQHEILTEHGWQEWHAVRKCPFLFQSALNSANLPFLDGSANLRRAGNTNIKHTADAVADEKPLSYATHLKAGVLRAVMYALKKHQPQNDIGVISKHYPIQNIADDYLIDLMQRLTGVITQKIKFIKTMVLAVFLFLIYGERTERNFFDMCRLSPAGISPNWIWTAEIPMVIMNKEIFALLRAPLMRKINEVSLRCNEESWNSKQKIKVYDLASAGPRNRFTVMTLQGPLIVHNCELSFGFSKGWYSAAVDFLKGHLGAPPIQFTEKDMEMMGIDPGPFLNNPQKIELVDKMPSRLELTDRLIHCAVTEAIVLRWRAAKPRIVSLWDTMEDAIDSMLLDGGMHFGPNGFLYTEKEAIIAPSGARLNYPGLQRSDQGEATYWDGRARVKLYGGALTNNVIQLLEQEIVGAQMLKVHEAGYKVAVECYDNVVCVVPEEHAEECLQFMLETMKERPAWGQDIPLAAEGGIGDTWFEAKS